MHSPWPLSLRRLRRPLRAMVTATEGARVGRQGPTMGRACSTGFLDGSGSQRHIAPFFDELRTGSGRS